MCFPDPESLLQIFSEAFPFTPCLPWSSADLECSNSPTNANSDARPSPTGYFPAYCWEISLIDAIILFCWVISKDVHYPCDLFNVWMYSFFHYPVEVNWVSNHLFPNLFDWSFSLIYANPSTYKCACPEVSLPTFASPNCNTTKLSQCFPPPPNQMAVMKRMQFRPGEESARGNKRFWMQSWGLVGWCEFQVLFPPVKCLCNCYPDIYIFTY